MAVVKELIKKEKNGSISFGNCDLPTKTKLADFEVAGDMYKVKTWDAMTKLERNGSFVYESIPGTAVNVFNESADEVSFFVEGNGQTQITLELESGKEYDITVDSRNLGVSKTDIGGKITFDADLKRGILTEIRIVRA